ncbi:YciI family protein [Kribbella sp. NPDC048915]|uniref:YciI family protein n=1 Tax=Kribbella sp. NPDC048915 TaxID=3155148 RepID=UPI0033C847DC
MKYMLLIYGNDDTWNTLHGEGIEHVMDQHRALADELTAKGELVDGIGLTTANARVVRVVDGVPAVTDGPFTEAKEVLAGYYVVDCTAERAAEIAARLPEARYSPIEIREFTDPMQP